MAGSVASARAAHLTQLGHPRLHPFPKGPIGRHRLGFAQVGQERQGLLARKWGIGLSCKLWGPCPQLLQAPPPHTQAAGAQALCRWVRNGKGAATRFSLWGPAQLPSSLNPPEQGGARYRSFPGTPGPAAGGGRGSGLESQPRKLMKDAP